MLHAGALGQGNSPPSFTQDMNGFEISEATAPGESFHCCITTIIIVFILLPTGRHDKQISLSCVACYDCIDTRVYRLRAIDIDGDTLTYGINSDGGQLEVADASDGYVYLRVKLDYEV